MADSKTADAQYIIGADSHIAVDQPGALIHADARHHSVVEALEHKYEGKPTDEEFKTLRRVSGKLPMVAYILCFVEFCERASYYSSTGIISNFVNRPLPKGGNGGGAPPRGTQQTAGALGLGTVKATAVSQSFKMLVYCLPVVFGYLSDVYTGRWNMIIWGVAFCGIAHVIMIASGTPSLLEAGHSAAPFMIGLYVLSIGSAMFKPNVSPTLLDQMKETAPMIETLKSGEKVIIDPEATTERVVLWFYMLINVGGFMAVPASYAAKDSGWLLTFAIPLIVYVPLPIVLFFLKKRLILHPPGGSDLFNCFKVLGICLKKGVFKIGRHGFWEPAKPSHLAASGSTLTVPWNDQFVEDVRRTFQACGMFCFFPIQFINDNGLGIGVDALSTMLITNGVPNDLIGNFNSLMIIVIAPVLNFGLYPFLRKYHIRYGPVARITTGLLMSALGAIGYTLINYYAYKLGPCGTHGSSASCVDADGISLVAPISIWWLAIPYSLGGVSELFINVPAYGIAYSRAPVNMRGLVSALNLFNVGVAYALGLAFAGLVSDPYLTWIFGGPSIIGFVATALFYYLFRHIDKEEYSLSMNDVRDVRGRENSSVEDVEPYEKTGIHAGEKGQTGSPVATSTGTNEDAVSHSQV